MKVKCDKCKASCTGQVERLIQLGWSRAEISRPQKQVFTRCPMHRAGLTEEVGKAQGIRIGG
ncbi:MAG: hypothetical protein AB1529_07940 [Candidatus Micrarchaeota archaeon]